MYLYKNSKKKFEACTRNISKIDSFNENDSICKVVCMCVWWRGVKKQTRLLNKVIRLECYMAPTIFMYCEWADCG